MLISYTWNHLTVCKQMSSNEFIWTLMIGRISSNWPITSWVECSPISRVTGVLSKVDSYQRRKKWYLITPCLTDSSIRCLSRVKWSNPGKGVALSPSGGCYFKRNLRVALNYSGQIYLYIYIYIYEQDLVLNNP